MRRDGWSKALSRDRWTHGWRKSAVTTLPAESSAGFSGIVAMTAEAGVNRTVSRLCPSSEAGSGTLYSVNPGAASYESLRRPRSLITASL